MMSKSENIGSGAVVRNRIRNSRFACSCLLLLLVISGCRRDMQDQPKMKPYRGTTFFADGLSARPPIEGTVARGLLRTDTEFFTGKRSRTTAGPRTQSIQGQQQQAQGGQQGQG